MRFYTFAWWMDCQHPRGVPSPFERYEAHLGAHAAALPACARTLSTGRLLHDARLDSFRFRGGRTAEDSPLDIGLVLALERGCGYAALRYRGVESIDTICWDDGATTEPLIDRMSDLGYNEFDVTPTAGVFRHGLLFWKGIELQIMARDLRVSICPDPSTIGMAPPRAIDELPAMRRECFEAIERG